MLGCFFFFVVFFFLLFGCSGFPTLAGEEGLSARNGDDGRPCHCQDPAELRRIIREPLLPELREAIFPELIKKLRDGLLPELRDVILRGMRQEETRIVPSGCPLSTVRIRSNQNQTSLGHFQLHFNNKLPEAIFTGNTIESKGNSPMQIFITDTDSKKITSGPLSKIKVEILVLYGDFGDEKLGTWTEEEFSKRVVREREGRGPLLKGNRVITLKGGIGSLGSISFTDNSKWTRTQKFRLGAIVLQNDLVEERIQEADSVDKLKCVAYNNQNDMNELPANTLSGHPSDLLATYTQEPNSLCLHNSNVQISREGYRTGASGDALPSAVPDYIQDLNRVEGQRQACCTMNSYKMDLISDLIQICHEAYETDTLVGHPSGLVCPEGSNHVETQQQACFDMNICKMDGVSDLIQIHPESGPVCIEGSSHVEGQQFASITMKSCPMHGVIDQEVYGTGSDSNNIMRRRYNNIVRRRSLRERPMIHISRSKSIKKSVSARRSARIQQIKWFKVLLVAVRFGVFIKLRAEAN